jgi:hypothetical protein
MEWVRIVQIEGSYSYKPLVALAHPLDYLPNELFYIPHLLCGDVMIAPN